ncbi:hypothetical protein E3N88_39800 [Mikania micrantha]|uniref:Reverse transcriptase Ty1/copia-type domain-containing protein n=1 Tax=Mikania micrantha TaxID=192012 RepID=A0A5N6LKT1_9ASTR|nr:hypothetical protein E3N88_39800 [Mikania micrantha]
MKCTLEQAVYTKRSKTSTLIVGVYVDDLIITGTPKREIELSESQMEEKFETSDLGLLSYYLDSNETKIPMNPGTLLTKTGDGKVVDATEYKSLIGCLRYLLHTRPDLCYSVGLLSRFMQEPKEHHMKAIHQILRYIKGTKDFGITYKRNGGCKLTGYSDSSYGVNTEKGKVLLE